MVAYPNCLFQSLLRHTAIIVLLAEKIRKIRRSSPQSRPSSDEMKDSVLSRSTFKSTTKSADECAWQGVRQVGWQLVSCHLTVPSYRNRSGCLLPFDGQLSGTAAPWRLLRDAFAGNTPAYTPLNCSPELLQAHQSLPLAQKVILEFAGNTPFATLRR